MACGQIHDDDDDDENNGDDDDDPEDDDDPDDDLFYFWCHFCDYVRNSCRPLGSFFLQVVRNFGFFVAIVLTTLLLSLANVAQLIALWNFSQKHQLGYRANLADSCQNPVFDPFRSYCSFILDVCHMTVHARDVALNVYRTGVRRLRDRRRYCLLVICFILLCISTRWLMPVVLHSAIGGVNTDIDGYSLSLNSICTCHTLHVDRHPCGHSGSCHGLVMLHPYCDSLKILRTRPPIPDTYQWKRA